ncbi:MAG: hypothetical protein IJL01_05620, partial [Synergistaceae bacterium]|nr:hypothetical protein [Synergistaceae bacterium]
KEWAADISTDELAGIVINHAIAAAAAGMAAGVLPGISALISSGIAVGAIWHMYYAIGKYVHLTFGKDILKAAASAILSNLAHQTWGYFAVEIAAMFIPLISIPATGFIFFAITYFSGLTFLLLLVALFKAGKDPTEMSADDIKNEAKKVAEDIDFREETKKVREGFKKIRKEGNFEEQARGVDIESD